MASPTNILRNAVAIGAIATAPLSGEIMATDRLPEAPPIESRINWPANQSNSLATNTSSRLVQNGSVSGQSLEKITSPLEGDNKKTSNEPVSIPVNSVRDCILVGQLFDEMTKDSSIWAEKILQQHKVPDSSPLTLAKLLELKDNLVNASPESIDEFLKSNLSASESAAISRQIKDLASVNQHIIEAEELGDLKEMAFYRRIRVINIKLICTSIAKSFAAHQSE